MRNPAMAIALFLLDQARGASGNINVASITHNPNFPDLPQAVLDEAVAALIHPTVGAVTAVVNGQGHVVTIHVTPQGQGDRNALLGSIKALGNQTLVLA